MRNPSSHSSPSPSAGTTTASAAAAAAAGGGASKGSSRCGSKSTTPCCSKVGMKRGPWTPEEDVILANYINREGQGKWRTLPKRAGLQRCGKSCRLRWMNYLRPNVKRGHIAPDEEDLILRLHRLLGNRWSLIAGRIPGRTDNEIKNYWNTHLSKKLISQGIDPRTHKPLDPDNPASNDQRKPSSSKRNNAISNHNPNYHTPSFSSEQEPPVFSGAPINDEQQNETVNFKKFNGTTKGLDNDDEDDINYCTDDMLSSFLNSLINEDVFNGQPQEPPNDGEVAGSSDVLISSPQNFGFGGAGWDAPIMSSAPAFHPK
ncbi:hypothetical protein LguiB_032107 [Lonicera macranthoides]